MFDRDRWLDSARHGLQALHCNRALQTRDRLLTSGALVLDDAFGLSRGDPVER